MRVNDLRVVVHTQTGKGAEAPHDNFYCIKRAAFDGAHTGVAQTSPFGVDRVALDAVIGGFAFAKVAVFAVLCQGVIALYCGFQALGIDVAGLGQFAQCLSSSQVAIFQPRAQPHGGGLDSA